MEDDDVATAAATTVGSLPELVTLIAQRLRGPQALSRAACVSRVWRDAVKRATITNVYKPWPSVAARIEPLASGDGFAALHAFRECIDNCGFPPGAALVICDFAWEQAPFFKQRLEQLLPPHVPVLVVNSIVPSGPGHEIEVEDDSGFCLLQLLPDVPGHVRAMPLRIDLLTSTSFWMTEHNLLPHFTYNEEDPGPDCKAVLLFPSNQTAFTAGMASLRLLVDSDRKLTIVGGVTYAAGYVHQGILHSNDEQFMYGLALTGPALHVARSYSEVTRLSDVERATQSLLGMLTKEGGVTPTMGLMASCAARLDINRGVEETELKIFRRTFPNIGLTGMLGGGEIGFFDRDLEPETGDLRRSPRGHLPRLNPDSAMHGYTSFYFAAGMRDPAAGTRGAAAAAQSPGGRL